MTSDNIRFIEDLQEVIRSRRTASAEQSYTKTLFNRGTSFIAQKVGEEAVELAIAAVQGNREQTIAEASDLVYHLLVLLEDSELTLADVASELAARHGNRQEHGHVS